MLEKWRELRKVLDISSDNDLAVYLLKRNKDLTESQRTVANLDPSNSR